jgi:hypothetical protein
MTRRADASRAMDVSADVALIGEKRCASVQTHTHLNAAGGKCFGHLSRRGECARRGGEGEKEGIALRVHLDTVVAGARLSYQAAMLGQCLRVTLGAELLEQPRRALNVGEEEGDGARREVVSHAS